MAKRPRQRRLAAVKAFLERCFIPGAFALVVVLLWNRSAWLGLGALVLGGVLLVIFWDPLTRLHGGRTLNGKNGPLNAVEFSAGGSNLLAASASGLLLEWDMESRRLLSAAAAGQIHSPKPPIRSPNEKRYALIADDNLVRVHDSITGGMLAEFRGHKRAITALAFSCDSARLATGGGDHCVVVWDLATRRLMRVLRGHRRPVTGVAFSPDGSLLASASADGTVKVWRVS